MRRFFVVYQYAAPLVLLPLCWYLWRRAFDGSTAFALLVLGIPTVSHYVVPAVGTNVLKLWEIRTRLRVGRFRPHHGLVFGAGTALLTLLCLDRHHGGIGVVEVVRAGLVVGSVLAFWNWFYDFLGLEAGFLVVYNKPWAEGAAPAAIAAEYAPSYFGTVGLTYGAEVRILEHLLLDQRRWDLAPWLFLGATALAIILPVLAFAGFNRLRTGDWGLRPYRRPGADGET